VPLLILALEEGDWSALCSSSFTHISRDRDSGTPWTWGWGGCRACLDMMAKRKSSASAMNQNLVIQPITRIKWNAPCCS